MTYLDIGDKFLQPDGILPKEIMPDLLHPNAKGYEIWANAITPVVEKYFPDQLGACANHSSNTGARSQVSAGAFAL